MTAQLASTMKGFVLLVLAAAAGCSTVDIELNAYRARSLAFPASSPADTVAVVVGADANEPLLQQEVAEKIARLLADQGYRVAPYEQAQYVLSCWFAMDTGRTYTGLTPMYEPSDVETYRVRGRRGHWRHVTTYYPGYTHYVPYSYTLFCKHLALTLTENKPLSQPDSQALTQAIVWRCTAVNCDPSTDLRWRTNHLLVAAFEYFGRDTAKQKKFSLDEKDKRVKRLARLPDD